MPEAKETAISSINNGVNNICQGTGANFSLEKAFKNITSK